jgi:hypothetical protein
MEKFLTLLAWIIGIPCSITFLVKMIASVQEGKPCPATIFTFVVSASCWAWIISR